MKVLHNSINKIGEFIHHMEGSIDNKSTKIALNLILGAEKVFVYGAGRSGLVARAFGMQLMHLGKNVYVIGETINPSAGVSDVIVIVSGSGETDSVVNLANIAKNNNVKVVAVTATKECRLTEVATLVLPIDVKIEKQIEHNYLARQLTYKDITSSHSTFFEISALVFLESFIEELLYQTGKTSKDLAKRHANLE